MNIACPSCNGSGRVKLTPVLQSTLNVIELLETPIVTEIYRNLPTRNRLTPTAANRRVQRLLKLKLIRKVAKSNPARYELVA